MTTYNGRWLACGAKIETTAGTCPNYACSSKFGGIHALPSDADSIALLLRRVAALEARVAELEKRAQVPQSTIDHLWFTK